MWLVARLVCLRGSAHLVSRVLATAQPAERLFLLLRAWLLFRFWVAFQLIAFDRTVIAVGSLVIAVFGAFVIAIVVAIIIAALT